MNDLRDLYQELILDHSRRPRNFRELEDADRRVEGYNPLCGDRLTVFLRMRGDAVEEATFHGSGCAISTASASLMTESLRGKTEAEARSLFEAFQGLVTGRAEARADLGKLAVFAGVREFPLRVKCATLPWHTGMAALAGRSEPVSTE